MIVSVPITIAIYLDPNTTNASSRIAQVHRYITFKDADLSTRRAGCAMNKLNLVLMVRTDLPAQISA